jgi:hypothetical protein
MVFYSGKLPTWQVFSSSVRSIVLVSTLLLTGCGVIKEKPPAQVDELDLVGKEIPPEQAQEILGEVGDSFVYGPSLGETITNVGVAILFPPYALYLVGNAILSVSGYEPVTVSSLLPEEEGKKWGDTVDTVMSGPGRMVAAMAGREARSREVTEEKMRQILTQLPNEKVVASEGVMTADEGTITR